MSDTNYFKTSTLSLCGFLELNGLKYVKAELTKSPKGKVKVEFYFLDPENKGSDLEIEFRFSNEKKYRDSIFFYRKIIQDLIGS
jgi:hypothetical protein